MDERSRVRDFIPARRHLGQVLFGIPILPFRPSKPPTATLHLHYKILVTHAIYSSEVHAFKKIREEILAALLEAVSETGRCSLGIVEGAFSVRIAKLQTDAAYSEQGHIAEIDDLLLRNKRKLVKVAASIDDMRAQIMNSTSEETLSVDEDLSHPPSYLQLE